MKVLSRLILIGITAIGLNKIVFAQGGQSAVPFLLLAPVACILEP